MKSYKFLKAISIIFQVIGWITLSGGVSLSLYMLISISKRTYTDSYLMFQDCQYTFYLSIGSMIAFLLLMALAQLINLFRDVAGNVYSMAKNIHTISKRENISE